jgi:hypothetical protein
MRELSMEQRHSLGKQVPKCGTDMEGISHAPSPAPEIHRFLKEILSELGVKSSRVYLALKSHRHPSQHQGWIKKGSLQLYH